MTALDWDTTWGRVSDLNGTPWASASSWASWAQGDLCGRLDHVDRRLDRLERRASAPVPVAETWIKH